MHINGMTVCKPLGQRVTNISDVTSRSLFAAGHKLREAEQHTANRGR
jgi:hypothetical protein